MVKVSYQSGLTFFTEYVCIQHPGYAGYKAQHWVNYRGGEATTAIELLNEAGTLKKPSRIKVDTRGKYPLIVDFEFDDKMNL
jgi:DNA repair protein RadD